MRLTGALKVSRLGGLGGAAMAVNPNVLLFV